jgi:hypothetical protein
MMKTPGSFATRARAGMLTVASILLAACGGDGGGGTEPITPASITAAATLPASLAAGSAVTPSPSVLVRGSNNRPMSGVAVTFTATGGGSVTTATATTNASGNASAGTWTLGTGVGANTLTAKVGALTTVFTVNATAGAPVALNAQADHPAAPTVGQTITPAVKLVDSFGNAIAGAPVTFTANSGTVAGGAVTTDANGIARVTGWTLGNTAGAQKLTATANALTTDITVTAAAAAPTQLTKQAGDGGSATVGTAVTSRPAVRVTDAFGNPVANVTVTFAVTAGGSIITGATQQTNTSGLAMVGSWTMGGAPGPNTLTATIAGGVTVTFNVTGTAAPAAFFIDVQFTTTVPAAQEAAFAAAAARWSGIITADVGNIVVPPGLITANICGITHPAFAGEVDDLVIFVNVTPLDGVGGLLGRAGPCFTRNSNNLPIVGIMEFDAADMANMESNGTLTSVITHEMGHVLGIGSLWSTLSLLNGGGGGDPFFNGAAGKSAFTQVGGTLVNGVPVENCLVGVPASCGAGTRDAHWREFTFGTELMTGYLAAGANPLSRVTIGSLQDMGYTVSFATADSFTLGGGLFQGGAQSGPLMHINDIVVKPIGRIRD